MNKKTLIYLVLIFLLVAGVVIFFNLNNRVMREESREGDVEEILTRQEIK